MGKAIEKVNPGRTRSRLAKAFRLEAVRLLELGEKPATQLAAELGIRRNPLHKWQAQVRDQGSAQAFRGLGANPLAQRSDIERLRRDLKRVTEERDIQKKRRRTVRRTGLGVFGPCRAGTWAGSGAGLPRRPARQRRLPFGALRCRAAARRERRAVGDAAATRLPRRAAAGGNRQALSAVMFCTRTPQVAAK
jgi:transposase